MVPRLLPHLPGGLTHENSTAVSNLFDILLHGELALPPRPPPLSLMPGPAGPIILHRLHMSAWAGICCNMLRGPHPLPPPFAYETGEGGGPATHPSKCRSWLLGTICRWRSILGPLPFVKSPHIQRLAQIQWAR